MNIEISADVNRGACTLCKINTKRGGESKTEQKCKSCRDRSDCRLHVITAELAVEISPLLDKSSPIHFHSHVRTACCVVVWENGSLP